MASTAAINYQRGSGHLHRFPTLSLGCHSPANNPRNRADPAQWLVEMRSVLAARMLMSAAILRARAIQY
jgi:hypothetical protein